MIISIVAIVVALITLGVLYGTRPTPKMVAGPPDVKTAPPTLGDIAVPMTNGVSSGTNQQQNRQVAFGGGGNQRAGFQGNTGGQASAPTGGGGGGPSGGGMSLSVGGATQVP